MADKREEILQRLQTILETVPGVTTCVRNRGLRKNEQRPAIVLVDGDEATVTTGGDVNSRARPVPKVMRMRPEIYYLPKEARPTGDLPDGMNVGEDLNNRRMQILWALMNDPELQTLYGSNGGISYQSMTTDLHSGAAMSGEMRIDIQINYVLDVINGA